MKGQVKKTNRWGMIVGVIVLAGVVFGGTYLVLVKGQDMAKLNPFKKQAEGRGVTLVLGKGTASEVVTNAGGVVQMETALGDKVVLDIPKDAMMASTAVSVSEIESVRGMPEGASFVSGVHIEGGAEVLLETGELYVPVPEGVAADAKLVGFTYDGEGNNFHLYPVTFDERGATFKIFHFSGYGLVQIDSPDFKKPEKSATEKDVMESILFITKVVGWQQSLGINEGFTEEQLNGIQDMLLEWYQNGVRPKLLAALKDDDLILDAAQEYLRWLQVVQGYGLEEGLAGNITEGENMLAKALANGGERAYKKCTQNKDATMSGRLLKLAQYAQALGLDGKEGVDAERLQELAAKCANFELRFRSKVSDNDNGESAELEGTIYLTVGDEFELSGEGKIRTTNVRMPDTWSEFSDCAMNPESYSESIRIPLTRVQVIDDKPTVSIVWQFLEDGPEITVSCAAGDWFNGRYPGGVTSYGFVVMHEDEVIDMDEGLMMFADWEIVNAGGVYARKTYNRTKEEIEENTVMELIHTPK